MQLAHNNQLQNTLERVLIKKFRDPECLKQLRVLLQVEAQESSRQEANETSQEELTSSDQETYQEVTFYPPRQQPQVVPSMFMPYIEGPKMDWTDK